MVQRVPYAPTNPLLLAHCVIRLAESSFMSYTASHGKTQGNFLANPILWYVCHDPWTHNDSILLTKLHALFLFSSFLLVPSLCSGILGRIPHFIQHLCFHSLLWTLTIHLAFLFLMTVTVLRNTDQILCRTALGLGLAGVTVRLWLSAWGRKTADTKRSSHHKRLKAAFFSITDHGWGKPDPTAEVVFAVLIWRKVTPLLPYCSLWKEATSCSQHVLRFLIGGAGIFVKHNHAGNFY